MRTQQNACLTGLSLLLLSTIVSFARAGDTYTTAQNGNWDDTNTWSPTGVPGDDDRAIIDCDHQITVRYNTEVDSLFIMPDPEGEFCTPGILTINPGITLTIDHDDGPSGDNQNNGYINLAGGTLKFVDTDQVLGGYGLISGYTLSGQNAHIIIEDSRELTIENVSIYGVLDIKPSAGNTATFRNHGYVNATHPNNPGYITLESNLILDDDETGHTRWQVVGANGGTLRFKRAATTLAGDFALNDNSNSKFLFDANVTTSGVFWCSSGQVDVESASFRYLDPVSLLQETINSDCCCSGLCTTCP